MVPRGSESRLFLFAHLPAEEWKCLRRRGGSADSQTFLLAPEKRLS
jgi:hypothetical protein